MRVLRQALLTTGSGVSTTMPRSSRSSQVLAHRDRCWSYDSGVILNFSDSSAGLVKIARYADSPVFSDAISAPRPGLNTHRGYVMATSLVAFTLPGSLASL